MLNKKGVQVNDRSSFQRVARWLDAVAAHSSAALYAGAGVTIALACAAAFLSPPGAWPLAIIAVSLVFTANLDKFSEVSAGMTGISAKMREAQVAINDVKKMIEVMASAELHQLQAIGRFDGNRDEDLKRYLDSITGLMREAGITEDRIRQIKAESWDRFVRFDYAYHILGGNMVPVGDDRSVESEWRRLRKFESHATPAVLADFLARHGDGNELRSAMLRSYEHYWATGSHLSEETWRDRRNVPQLGGKQVG